MTQEIREGFDSIFMKLPSFAGKFNKDTYEESFKSLYKEFHSFLDALEIEYEKAADKSAFLDEVSGYLPEKMSRVLATVDSKRKKEKMLVDYNMGMAMFVIPLLRYSRKNCHEQMVERILDIWNDNGLSMKLGKSSYEEIKGGFKSGLCYITTAVCESLGKADDCYELNLLRTYRDTYLSSTEEGKDVVKKYYDVAPTIVNRIRHQENASEIFENIWNDYLQKCVKLIEHNEMSKCQECYADMVHDLQEKYLYS